MTRAIFGAGFFLLLQLARGEVVTNAPPATAPAAGESVKKNQALVETQSVTADPSVFAGDKFPPIDFINKDLLRRALGPYTLTVRFFDADWKEVTAPRAEGRYGAAVEIHFAGGESDVRHLTLYHVGPGYSPTRDPYRSTIKFPQALSLPSNITETESWNVNKYINDTFEEARQNDEYYAAFLAALHDADMDPASLRGFEYIRIDNIWWQELEKRQGWEIPYQKLVRLPDGYEQSGNKKWPLILFLHGSGERGDDLAILKPWGPASYADQGHPLPFIVVTPQCRKRERWDPRLLVAMLEEIEKTCRVDPSRIYLTGLSMGGIGAIDLAAAYPGKFAALAPLSARENPEIAPRLREIPTWLFHGTIDDVVATQYSVDLGAALKKLGGPVKLTLLPGVGHGGWEKVYADPQLYAWFLQYHL
jgi:predicted esterase